MHNLTIEQTADYLETATIETTVNTGHAIIHAGKNAAGVCFVMMNDACGKTMVCESL